MKRKYYLRGLGFGILITSLVFMLTGSKELSDEEIIRRAEQLGYAKVEEEVTPTINLSELKEKGTPTPVVTKEPDPPPTEMAETTNTPMPTEVPEITNTPTPTEEPEIMNTPTPTEEPEITNTPTPTEEPEITNTPPPSEEKMQVIVERGDSARKVCAKMEQAGVIEDAEEFRTYLTKNGWADDINIGTYAFTKGLEFRELARILTGK